MTRHSAILTNMLLNLSLATGLLCAASNASAQNSGTATIPFSFSADDVKFPAGTYEVTRLPYGVMSLYNLATGKTQLLTVRPERENNSETKGRLVFHHDETGNSLIQVWVAGTAVHSELMVQPHIHQTVAKNSSHTDSTIQMALK